MNDYAARELRMRCPRCNSPAPHLHPAVQHGGEVQVCRDSFHKRVTTQNTAERIAAVHGDPPFGANDD